MDTLTANIYREICSMAGVRENTRVGQHYAQAWREQHFDRVPRRLLGHYLDVQALLALIPTGYLPGPKRRRA